MKGDGLKECQTNHNQAGNDMYVFKDWWEDVDEVHDVYDESENDSEDVKSLDGFDRDFDVKVSYRDDDRNGNSYDNNDLLLMSGEWVTCVSGGVDSGRGWLDGGVSGWWVWGVGVFGCGWWGCAWRGGGVGGGWCCRAWGGVGLGGLGHTLEWGRGLS
ncbi:hypothetical protein Tco_1463719 [Tanacetum coccineum]